MTLSDEAFKELRAECNQAVKNIIAGKPDRTDLMIPLKRARSHISWITANEIINAVALETGLSQEILLGRKKDASVCRARHLMIYLAHEVSPARSKSELGRRFNRDWTTVNNSITQASCLMKRDEDFVSTYRRVKTSLGLKT